MPQTSYDYYNRMGIHPISWEDFHGICKALAIAVSRFEPEIILPIGRGGYYPGTLLAHMLQIEVYPVRVSRRVNDIVKYTDPHWIIAPPSQVAGHRILIVDEICDTGGTIHVVKEKALEMGASLVKSAVLYSHTKAPEVPDYIGILTDELLLNPWDREVVKTESSFFIPSMWMH